MELIHVLLSAGALGTIATVIGMIINRRNVKSEAEARDLKSPVEVDNLVATVHRSNIESVLAVNAELRTEIKEQEARADKLRERVDKLEERQRIQGQAQEELGQLVQILQRGLASAYAYITTLLQLAEEHMPHIVVPNPPSGYRKTTAEQQRDPAQ